MTICGDIRFEHHNSSWRRHNRDGVSITVRVDTDDEIQLICKHH